MTPTTTADHQFDVSVRERAWGIHDPRVIPLLSYENQPIARHRAEVIGRRAAAAGWPDEATSNAQDSRRWRAARRAARQEATGA